MGNLYYNVRCCSKINILEIMGDNKMSKIKMKDLLSEVFDETPKVDKHQVIEGVRN